MSDSRANILGMNPNKPPSAHAMECLAAAARNPFPQQEINFTVRNKNGRATAAGVLGLGDIKHSDEPAVKIECGADVYDELKRRSSLSPIIEATAKRARKAQKRLKDREFQDRWRNA